MQVQQHQPLYSQLLHLLSRQDGLQLDTSPLPASPKQCQSALNQLKNWQVPIQQQNQHYQIPCDYQHLEADKIQQQLTTQSQKQLHSLDVFASIGSTNQYLLQKHPAQIRACLANHQHQGRGQHGKTWHSRFASGLYLSLSYPYPKPPPPGLSLAIALSIHKQLQQQGYQNIKIKWPNDLIWQQKKLAGILVEMRHQAKNCYSVIGLGLNWQNQQLKNLAYSHCDLSQIQSRHHDHNHLAASLINALLQSLNDFPKQGLKPHLNDWQQHDALYGKSIEIQQTEKQQHGIACGITPDGALKIKTPQGQIQTITQGSVRIALPLTANDHI